MLPPICYVKNKTNLSLWWTYFHVASYGVLRILTRKSCDLLNSVQDFTDRKAWVLLTFFICLQGQYVYIIMFIHSIAIYYRLQMFVKSDSLNRHKMNDCSFQRVFPQNVGWFLFGIPEKWDRDPGWDPRMEP